MRARSSFVLQKHITPHPSRPIPIMCKSRTITYNCSHDKPRVLHCLRALQKRPPKQCTGPLKPAKPSSVVVQRPCPKCWTAENDNVAKAVALSRTAQAERKAAKSLRTGAHDRGTEGESVHSSPLTLDSSDGGVTVNGQNWEDVPLTPLEGWYYGGQDGEDDLLIPPAGLLDGNEDWEQ